MVFTIITLSALLAASVFFNIRYAKLLMNTEDEINNRSEENDIVLNEIVSVLNSSYTNISHILKTPIGEDSIEIRKIVGELKRAKNSVEFAKNKLTEFQIKR